MSALNPILAGVNLASGIVKGIVGDSAHRKYAKELSNVHLHMPTAVEQAQGIYSDLAGRGLAGKDLMIQDLLGNQASDITTAKEVADNPTALLNAVTKINGNTNSGLNKIDIADAQVHDQNQQLLARFLDAVKAPAQNRIDSFEANKAISIAKEKMAGTKELLDGIQGGIGNAISAYGQGKQLDFTQAQTDAIKKYWGLS